MPFQRLSNGAIRLVNGKALLLSSVSTTPPPVVAVTAIALTPAAGTANSAAGTVIGTLAATVSNGPLNSPVWTLTGTAGGDFQIVNGNQVAVLPSNVPAGSYTITAQVAASNLATPFSQAVTVTMNSSGNPGTAPAKLSDITWTQPYPAHPNASDASTVGYFDPVNGIGPFKFTFSVANANGGNDTGNYAFRGEGLFVVSTFGTSPGTVAQTITATCVDGRGDTVTRSFPIARSSDTSHRVTINTRNPNNNAFANGVYSDRHLRADAQGLGVQFVAQDGSALPSGLYYNDGGPSLSFANGHPTPASYPIRVTATDGQTPIHLDYTWVMTAPTPISYIEFVPVPIVSTSMPAGVLVGHVRATTPNNNPGWVIDDGGTGLLAVNEKGEILLRKMPTSVGALPFSMTCSDDTATFTDHFSFNVVQGVTLAPSAIQISPNTLSNYLYRAEYTQRAVGTPTVTRGAGGFPSGSTLSWKIIKLQRTSYAMDTPNQAYTSRAGVGYPRFACDPNTGACYAQAHLSARFDTDFNATGEWFDLMATDGIYTAVKRVFVPVTAVVGPKYYVGPNTPPSGFTQMATLKDAISPFIDWEGDVTAIAGAEIRVEYDPSNPNRYANDWSQDYYFYRKGINGPMHLKGIPGPNGELPYFGCTRGTAAAGPYDKGIFVTNNGDFTIENLEMGWALMGQFADNWVPASNYTLSAIRQNGGCSGDITIINCDLHDCDVPIEAGSTDSQWTLTGVRLTNGAGCTSGGGANQHNAYIGAIWNIVATDVLSFGAANGHIFKCRAMNGTWTRMRFFDGERGSGFNCLDLPDGGNHTLIDCIFEKGPQSMNPFWIQFAEEVGPNINGGNDLIYTGDYVNSLTLIRPRFIRHCADVIGKTAINFCARIAPNTGAKSTLTITDPVFEGFVQGNEFVVSSLVNPGVDFSDAVTMTGATYPSTFTPLDFTSPVSKDLGRPGWYNAVAWLNNGGDMPFFNDRQIDPGVDYISIPANAAPGTMICVNMKAYGAGQYQISGATQPDIRIAPFVAGTTWGPGQTLGFHTGESFNYAQSHFAFSSNSDGTGNLLVGSSGLGGAGCDIVLVRAVAPNGTIVEKPLFVVKTA